VPPTAATATIKTAELPIVEQLRRVGVTFVSGVADSGVKALVAALEGDPSCGELYVLATREDNAVALAAGSYLAGEQPLVFMESSGIGNAIDALTSLAGAYRMPIVLLIVWAGYDGRDVPHHNAIGEPLAGLLDALGVPRIPVRLAEAFAATAAAIADAVRLARQRGGPVAVLGIPANLENPAEEGGAR